MQSVALGLSSHQEQIEVRRTCKVIQQPGPVRLRPVLALAAAAGMKGQGGAWRGAKGKGGSEGQAGDGVGIEDGEAFEGLEVNLGGVETGAVVGAVRSLDELGAGAEGHIGLEDAIRDHLDDCKETMRLYAFDEGESRLRIDSET